MVGTLGVIVSELGVGERLGASGVGEVVVQVQRHAQAEQQDRAHRDHDQQGGGVEGIERSNHLVIVQWNEIAEIVTPGPGQQQGCHCQEKPEGREHLRAGKDHNKKMISLSNKVTCVA